jgi:alkylation response protein AidB-like acyl-CoA dehydrogenase
VDFERTPERRMLVDTIDRYLADRYDIAERNRIAFSPQGWSREHWRALAELGVIGALFSESAGGFAGGPFDIAAVFEALGRRLSVEPFLGTLIAGRMLAAAGEHELLAQSIAGETLVLPALDEAGASRRATRGNGTWRLSGAKSVVAQAEAAGHFLVTAFNAAGQLALFAVERGTPGLAVIGYALIDGGRGGDVVLDGTPARLLLAPDAAAPAVEAAIAAGLVALSSEAVAIMTALCDQTVDFLSTRRQFGQPIGQFQALRHRMATLALEIEQARSAATNAAAALDGERVARERAVSAAKFTIGRVGTLVAEEAIQMHGGIGMTWELPLSHYAKRLVMIGHLLGDEDYHLDRYIALSR